MSSFQNRHSFFVDDMYFLQLILLFTIQMHQQSNFSIKNQIMNTSYKQSVNTLSLVILAGAIFVLL